MLSLSSRDGTWAKCTSDFTRCLSCDTVATHVDAFTGKCPSCQAHGTHREVPAEEVLSALRERNALRAEVERLKAAPVVGGVPKLTDEESARMKAVALSCGRHDANGELLCGSCKHSWREVNLEDCDEGCSVGRVDLFFHGEPWQDCPDFASLLSSIKPGEVETCEWHPGDIPGTGVRGWETACGEAMYPKHRWRLGVDGCNYCPNCGKRVVQVSDDEWAAQSAQATTSGEVGR